MVFQYERIKDEILSLISKEKPGFRVPPERELSKKYRVARLTVNRAMRELEREGLLQREVGRGTFIAQPKEQLILNDNNIMPFVYLISPEYPSYTLWQSICAVSIRLKNANIVIKEIRFTAKDDFNRFFSTIPMNSACRGAVILPTGLLAHEDCMQIDTFFPRTVILDALPHVERYRNIYCVHKSYFQSGYIKIKRLSELGHTRFMHIAHEPKRDSLYLHSDGMKTALSEQKIPIRNLSTLFCNTLPWEYSPMNAYNEIRRLSVKKIPSALIFDTASGAIAGMRALFEKKVRIPQDVSIVANGAISEEDRFLYPRIATVQTDVEHIAEKTASIFLEMNTGIGKSFVIDVRLDENETIAIRK